MISSLTPSFLPSFFVLGTTHSPMPVLNDIMALHPEVYLPENYSRYFSDDELYTKGLGSYYLKFTDAANQQIIGDVSTGYFYYPAKVIKRLKFLYNSDLANIKLIVCLNNPFSQFCFSFQENLQQNELANLSELLITEQLLLADDWYQSKGRTSALLLQSCLYAEQIKPWLAAFGEDNILFLHDFELEQSPIRAYRKVCRFLGVNQEIMAYEQRRVVAQQAIFQRSNWQKVNKIIQRFKEKDASEWADVKLKITQSITNFEMLTGVDCTTWQTQLENNSVKQKVWLQSIFRLLS